MPLNIATQLTLHTVVAAYQLTINTEQTVVEAGKGLPGRTMVYKAIFKEFFSNAKPQTGWHPYRILSRLSLFRERSDPGHHGYRCQASVFTLVLENNVSILGAVDHLKLLVASKDPPSCIRMGSTARIGTTL
ncbi:hypothetical protein KL909_003278 [Ogataea angusta]|nr:hypothetical protein KL909_003278 [Ogataea angusta]